MKPTVLLYNFTDSKRKMKVQQALMPLGFRLRAVTKEEYGLPVGVLAGVKGLNEDVLKEAGQAIEAGEETQKEESAQKQADGRLQREVPENDSSRKMDLPPSICSTITAISMGTSPCAGPGDGFMRRTGRGTAPRFSTGS